VAVAVAVAMTAITTATKICKMLIRVVLLAVAVRQQLQQRVVLAVRARGRCCGQQGCCVGSSVVMAAALPACMRSLLLLLSWLAQLLVLAACVKWIACRACGVISQRILLHAV
jgi:hypothetical protein